MRASGLLAILLPLAAVQAVPPDVKTLFPSGGQRGTTTVVTVGGNLGAAPQSVWCSRPDVKVEPATDAGKFNVTIPAEASPGVCWLRWANAEGASAQKPFVIGTLPELAEKEPNNEPATATVLENSRVVVNGVLDKNGEVDVYAVTLKKGQTLVAWLDANEKLGSPMDGSLQILNPKGFVRVQNDDDHGLDPLAVYTAETDGVHYVRLFAFPSATNASVVLHGGADYIYRLTLSTGPFVDFTYPLVATSAPGAVRLFGWNLPSDPFTAEPAAVAGDSTVKQLTGPAVDNLLSLPVVPHAAEVEAPAMAGGAPQKIVPPVTVTGRIETKKEKDRFQFAAKKGERWIVRTEARSLGSPLDPAVRILDTMGKTLQEVDDTPKIGADPEFVFSAPADGDYFVQVRDLYDDGGLRYYYRVTIEQERPAANLTLAADQFVVPIDKPLEIPVTIERIAGLKADLELQAVGLPDGLKASPVTSKAADATGKMVKFVVERVPGEASAKLPAGVPWKLVARTIGASPEERFSAEFPIIAPKTRTENLWLAIPTAPAAEKK